LLIRGSLFRFEDRINNSLTSIEWAAYSESTGLMPALNPAESKTAISHIPNVSFKRNFVGKFRKRPAPG
jgi:hypothetical protein